MSGSEQLRGVRSSAVGPGRSSDKTGCVHLCNAFEERRWKHSAQSRIHQVSCSWAFACGLLSLPPTPVHSAVTEDAERRDIDSLGGLTFLCLNNVPSPLRVMVLVSPHHTPSPAVLIQAKAGSKNL